MHDTIARLLALDLAHALALCSSSWSLPSKVQFHLCLVSQKESFGCERDAQTQASGLVVSADFRAYFLAVENCRCL
jgi:hypothetical protein